MFQWFANTENREARSRESTFSCHLCWEPHESAELLAQHVKLHVSFVISVMQYVIILCTDTCGDIHVSEFNVDCYII